MNSRISRPIPKPHAGDHAAVRDIDLRQIVRKAMYGTDSPTHREAAAEEIMRDAARISRLDADFEVLHGLFIDEMAEQLHDALACKHQLGYVTADVTRRRLEALRHTALLRAGSLLFDLFDKEIGKLIDDVVESDGMRTELGQTA